MLHIVLIQRLGCKKIVGEIWSCNENALQTWDSKMTWKIFIDMAPSFWFFWSFLAKSISFYLRNQIYTALGFQKYSHCNKVLYIPSLTIPFYSVVSLLTKKLPIFAKEHLIKAWAKRGPSLFEVSHHRGIHSHSVFADKVPLNFWIFEWKLVGLLFG